MQKLTDQLIWDNIQKLTGQLMWNNIQKLTLQFLWGIRHIQKCGVFILPEIFL